MLDGSVGGGGSCPFCPPPTSPGSATAIVLIEKTLIKFFATDILCSLMVLYVNASEEI